MGIRQKWTSGKTDAQARKGSQRSKQGPWSSSTVLFDSQLYAAKLRSKHVEGQERRPSTQSITCLQKNNTLKAHKRRRQPLEYTIKPPKSEIITTVLPGSLNFLAVTAFWKHFVS
jgi:hypothetical protein